MKRDEAWPAACLLRHMVKGTRVVDDNNPIDAEFITADRDCKRAATHRRQRASTSISCRRSGSVVAKIGFGRVSSADEFNGVTRTYPRRRLLSALGDFYYNAASCRSSGANQNPGSWAEYSCNIARCPSISMRFFASLLDGPITTARLRGSVPRPRHADPAPRS